VEKYVPPPEEISSSSELNRSQENVEDNIEEDYEDVDNETQEETQNNLVGNPYENRPNDLDIEAVRTGLARGNILIEAESSDEGVVLNTLYQEEYEGRL
jgi:hypothetical protein